MTGDLLSGSISWLGPSMATVALGLASKYITSNTSISKDNKSLVVNWVLFLIVAVWGVFVFKWFFIGV